MRTRFLVQKVLRAPELATFWRKRRWPSSLYYEFGENAVVILKSENKFSKCVSSFIILRSGVRFSIVPKTVRARLLRNASQKE